MKVNPDSLLGHQEEANAKPIFKNGQTFQNNKKILTKKQVLLSQYTLRNNFLK
jgi:hypothetical protein